MAQSSDCISKLSPATGLVEPPCGCKHLPELDCTIAPLGSWWKDCGLGAVPSPHVANTSSVPTAGEEEPLAGWRQRPEATCWMAPSVRCKNLWLKHATAVRMARMPGVAASFSGCKHLPPLYCSAAWGHQNRLLGAGVSALLHEARHALY